MDPKQANVNSRMMKFITKNDARKINSFIERAKWEKYLAVFTRRFIKIDETAQKEKWAGAVSNITNHKRHDCIQSENDEKTCQYIYKNQNYANQENRTTVQIIAKIYTRRTCSNSNQIMKKNSYVYWSNMKIHAIKSI